ncbi:hypothetical protein MRB53_017075 [Persea americana]|uniref:Uncharacterized protein n=1 Tax=Persea americana TaxID=3435 RepID=A0ACC2M422_PERAE|nr:hypothetical protein MRB53_017075 [Persea americana]
MASCRVNLFTTPAIFFFIIFLVLSSAPLEATRPLDGAGSLWRERTLFQSLQKGSGGGPGHSPCSYTPTPGGKCPTPPANPHTATRLHAHVPSASKLPTKKESVN